MWSAVLLTSTPAICGLELTGSTCMLVRREKLQGAVSGGTRHGAQASAPAYRYVATQGSRSILEPHHSLTNHPLPLTAFGQWCCETCKIRHRHLGDKASMCPCKWRLSDDRKCYCDSMSLIQFPCQRKGAVSDAPLRSATAVNGC